MTQSLSEHRSVNSRCSLSASSSIPIQRNLRMRLTISFVLLLPCAASSCFGCVSVIGSISSRVFLFGFYRLHATQTSDVAVWACRSIVAPLAGANRASSAKPSALTYWPARARVQACAAAYCGGTLAGAISNTGSAAVRCGALRRRQEEAQKRCDRGDDGEMTDTTMGQYLRRITGGDEPRRASALAT